MFYKGKLLKECIVPLQTMILDHEQKKAKIRIFNIKLYLLVYKNQFITKFVNPWKSLEILKKTNMNKNWRKLIKNRHTVLKIGWKMIYNRKKNDKNQRKVHENFIKMSKNCRKLIKNPEKNVEKIGKNEAELWQISLKIIENLVEI